MYLKHYLKTSNNYLCEWLITIIIQYKNIHVMQNIWRYVSIALGIILLSYISYNVGTKSKEAKVNEQETKTALISQIRDSIENKEKEKKLKAEKELREKKKTEFIRNWSDYISVKDTSYGWRLVGGCKNINLSLINGSDYEIDEAVIRVELYRFGGKNVCEQRVFTISNIYPNSAKSIDSGSFSCGVNHKVFLQSVESKSIDFHYVNSF